ncbi:hypothetical protein AAMO2058_000891000 [Amorphochlora amoebiformis]
MSTRESAIAMEFLVPFVRPKNIEEEILLSKRYLSIPDVDSARKLLKDIQKRHLSREKCSISSKRHALEKVLFENLRYLDLHHAPTSSRKRPKRDASLEDVDPTPMDNNHCQRVAT